MSSGIFARPNNITDGNIIMAGDTYRDAVRAVSAPCGQRVKRW